MKNHKCYFCGVLIVLFLVSCASLPEIKHKKFTYPVNEAFIKRPKRLYTVLGSVKSRVDFPTLDPNREVDSLCVNYFNSAVHKLVEYAKDKGADAVMDVRSVVFLMNGKMETYPRPECSDDGAEGQVLTQGVAIKWKKAD